jgi:hypothetical protein
MFKTFILIGLVLSAIGHIYRMAEAAQEIKKHNAK